MLPACNQNKIDGQMKSYSVQIRQIDQTGRRSYIRLMALYCRMSVCMCVGYVCMHVCSRSIQLLTDLTCPFLHSSMSPQPLTWLIMSSSCSVFVCPSALTAHL